MFKQEEEYWEERAAKARADLEAAMVAEPEKPIGPDARARMFVEADQSHRGREPELVDWRDLPTERPKKTPTIHEPQEQMQTQPQMKPAKRISTMIEGQED